jgi:hypothetical protein
VAIEQWKRRAPGGRARSRRGLTLGRGTRVLGGVAVSAAVLTAALEWGRVWRRGSAPLPRQTEHLVAAGGIATRETLAVVREGYRASPDRENVLLNLLASFTVTFGLTRATTSRIRTGSGAGVLRDLRVGDRHVHHFLPGLVVVFITGGTAIASHNEHLDRWLAVPFGAGAALVLDEAALLLELEDVYWSEEGVLSVQLSFATIGLLAVLALAVRLVRRGEPQVLEPQPPEDTARA